MLEDRFPKRVLYGELSEDQSYVRGQNKTFQRQTEINAKTVPYIAVLLNWRLEQPITAVGWHYATRPLRDLKLAEDQRLRPAGSWSTATWCRHSLSNLWTTKCIPVWSSQTSTSAYGHQPPISSILIIDGVHKDKKIACLYFC